MALFQLIDREQILPPEGTSREGLALDVKARPTTDPFEMGKDMAAFANATGGVILVGANDSAGLITYKPLLTEKEADDAKRNYEVSLRDRLSPAPRVDILVIATRGKFLVAVNVWPSPGQPVGVSIGGSRSSPSAGFAFPVRVGSQTEW